MSTIQLLAQVSNQDTRLLQEIGHLRDSILCVFGVYTGIVLGA